MTIITAMNPAVLDRLKTYITRGSLPVGFSEAEVRGDLAALETTIRTILTHLPGFNANIPAPPVDTAVWPLVNDITQIGTVAEHAEEIGAEEIIATAEEDAHTLSDSIKRVRVVVERFSLSFPVVSEDVRLKMSPTPPGSSRATPALLSPTPLAASPLAPSIATPSPNAPATPPISSPAAIKEEGGCPCCTVS